MQRLISRRRVLTSGAALAVTAPLSRAPLARGRTLPRSPRPAAARPHVPLAASVVARDLPAPDGNALTIRTDRPEYTAVYQTLRRFNSETRTRQQLSGVALVTDWVWSLPEALRTGFLDLIADVEDQWHMHLVQAFGTVHDDWLVGQLGALPDDTAPQGYSAVQRTAALRQPTTMAATLLALSTAIGLPPAAWLDEDEAQLVTQVGAA